MKKRPAFILRPAWRVATRISRRSSLPSTPWIRCCRLPSTNVMVRLSLLLLAVFGIGAGIGPVGPAAKGSGATPGPRPDGPAPAVQGADSPPPETPVRGVVWTPPRDPRTGLGTLNRMARYGVTGVRLTRPVLHPAVLARADSLGLALYMDLPVPPRARFDAALRDTVGALQAAASRHPSIRGIGLAPLHPGRAGTCRLLDGLRTRLRGDSSLRSYYVTPLPPSADPCSEDADLLLADLRAARDPTRRWKAWQDAVDGPVGIGALGTWMRPSGGRGLLFPHSPERQARFLENQLAALLSPSATAPPVVFVYRWSDPPAREAALPTRAYGLFQPDGDLRPVGRVLRGMYTGRQTVFAFPRGQQTARGWTGLVILGWIVIGGLAVVAAQAPLVRRTAARYFSAHGFYRDAVREGRETLPRTHFLLLGAVAAAVGIVSASTAWLLDALPATALLLERLPRSLAAALDGSLAAPSRAGWVLGGASLGLLAAWCLLLALASQEWRSIRYDQVLMLVTWACWPVFPLMIAALVVAAQPPAPASAVVAAVGSVSGLVAATAVGRVLHDYVVISGVPVGIALLLALLSPPAMAAAGLVAVVVHFDVPVSALWTLATTL